MKIIILQGSPNKKGSTSILAESFAKGAVEAGHKVERFDLAKMNIHPCIGCVACGYEGPCVQKDDNQQIREAILGADMVVFATRCTIMECPHSLRSLWTDFVHTTAVSMENI